MKRFLVCSKKSLTERMLFPIVCKNLLESGFGSISNFSRLFKSFGLTPPPNTEEALKRTDKNVSFFSKKYSVFLEKAKKVMYNITVVKFSEVKIWIQTKDPKQWKELPPKL